MYYKGKLVARRRKDSDFQGRGDEIRRELNARLGLAKGTRVLDIGTGLGNNVSFLRRTLPADTRIWSVDPSEEALRKAGKRLREEGLAEGVILEKGTTEELPFQDDFFDLAVCVMVLHHLEMPALGD